MGGLMNALGSLFDPSRAYDPAADRNLQSRIADAVAMGKAGLAGLTSLIYGPQSLAGKGAAQVRQGVQELATPPVLPANADAYAGRAALQNQMAQGASDVIRGATPYLAVAGAPGLVAAPVPGLIGLGAGTLASKGVETLANRAGVAPGIAALTSDVASFPAGALGAEYAPEIAQGITSAATGTQDLINRLNFNPELSPEAGVVSRRPKAAPPPAPEPEEPPALPTLGDLMDNPLALPGKQLTHDLGAALDQTVKGGELPKIAKGMKPADLDPHRQRALEMMRRDVNWALGNLPEAEQARVWYSDDVDAMERQLAADGQHPEFQDPSQRSLFKYLLGITSNGVNPEDNFAAAMKGWNMYQKDGYFSAYDRNTPSPYGNPKGTGLTFRANSYQGAIARLNQLIQDQGGVSQAIEWLQTKHPVSELKDYYDDVPGKAKDMRYGSYIFGEKVGSFGANLNGIHSELTADKWWSRTWNRWMGTVMATDEDGNPVLNKETNLPMLQDSPRNGMERNLMRETAAQVASELGLNVDELQAVLWYTEQSLYRAHGLEAGSIGYDQAAQNYFAKRAALRPGEDVGVSAEASGAREAPQPRASKRGPPKAPPPIPAAGPAGAQPAAAGQAQPGTGTVGGGAGVQLPAAPQAPRAQTLAPSLRPPANPELQRVVNQYNAQRGLPPVDHSQYYPTDKQFQQRVADAYEALQDDNSADPKVRAAYEALVRETKDQYNHLTQNGYRLEPWTQEGQPYQNSHEMVADLRNNKHLYFFTGGEPHPLLDQIDPDTGLTHNALFRAVHDAWAHATGGFGFGPRGEEMAHDMHSQSFSPLARQAMTTETRGQNSWVNYGRHNYDAQGNYLDIPATERPYAKQKVDLLPPEMQTRAGLRQPAAQARAARTRSVRKRQAEALPGPTPPGFARGGLVRMAQGGLASDDPYLHRLVSEFLGRQRSLDSLRQPARYQGYASGGLYGQMRSNMLDSLKGN